MSVQLTPKGTRGASFPAFKGPLGTIFRGMNVLAYRLLGGRVKIQGGELLLLITTGAKSGLERKVTLGSFSDPGRSNSWLVVASKGGAATHPDWYVNLAKNPDKTWIETKSRGRIKVRPESLTGPERQAAWDRVVAAGPGYGEYEKKTDREIPIVRLTAE